MAFIFPVLGAFICLVLFALVYDKNKTLRLVAQFGELQRKQPLKQEKVEPPTPDYRRKLEFQDKLLFTLGVFNTGFTPYILGAAPLYYYLWYTAKAISLLSLRWYKFYESKQHYLLYDFCYWANLLALIYVWILPQNERVFQVLFMCANGPLAWSVFAFNNSLIFHSYAHLTSVFIHISPMMLTYGLRWYSSTRFRVCEAMTKHINQFSANNSLTNDSWFSDGTISLPMECDESLSSLVWNALIYFYLGWIIFYYIWIFLVLGKYLEKRGLQTLYDWITTEGILAFLFRKLTVSNCLKQAVYMSMHLVFGIVTMLLAGLWWTNKFAHTCFVILCCTTTSWNAGTFYFQVFSRDYETRLQERILKKQTKAQPIPKTPPQRSQTLQKKKINKSDS